MISGERLFLVVGKTHRRVVNRMFYLEDTIPVPIPHHVVVVAVSTSDAVDQEIKRIGARGRTWNELFEELRQQVEAKELTLQEVRRKIDPPGTDSSFLSPTLVFEPDSWYAEEVSLEEYDITVCKKVITHA